MTHVVVDPVTRIEGHLRIEAEVGGGKVNDAWSSSTMFRGIEIILKGRDPRDAWVFTQRICGVCTTVHAIASIRAVEHAIGAVPPPNARILRNLIIAAQCVQDHVIHFYHLQALDWVDITAALKADPAKTAALAQSISDWPLSSVKYFLVGGMATPVDPDSQNALNVDTIAALTKLIASGRDFVTRVYVPDVLAVASFYKEWASIGSGVGNYMVYGDYPEDDTANPRLWLPSGVIRARNLAKVETFDPRQITEQVAHSWYDYSAGDSEALHPYKGETNPHYTGPNPPFERLDVAQKYSWLKSPRYDHEPMEVGPLARMLVAYARGNPPRVKELVDKSLASLGVGAPALFSTLGRIAARAIETQVIVEKMGDWVTALGENMARRDYRIQDNAKWEPETWPKDCYGAGFHEAPRGALGHWVHIHDGAIVNYQCVVPSTWNAGPRDSSGKPGPYEAALLGTPVAKPEQPLEILRTVHSFDPCMACGVHVVDNQRRELVRVKAV
jgi:hydrogenase large subunit